MNTNQKKSFLIFWNEEKDKLHKKVVSESHFSPSLVNVKWRIDQITNVREISESTNVVAVVEITKKKQKEENVIFEVDKNTLSSILDKLNQIQDKIDLFSQ